MSPGYEPTGVDAGFYPSGDASREGDDLSYLVENPSESKSRGGMAYQDLQRNRMQRGLPVLSSLKLGPDGRQPGYANSEAEELESNIRVLTKKDRTRLHGHADMALLRSPSAGNITGGRNSTSPSNRVSLFDMLRAESDGDQKGAASGAHSARLGENGLVSVRAGTAGTVGMPPGSMSARPGSTMGLRAMLASQSASRTGGSSRPETAASRLAQSLEQFSIRPGTTSSRGYGSVRWRKRLMMGGSEADDGTSGDGVTSRGRSARGGDRSGIVSASSSRRRGTAMLQFEVEGLLAEQASKAAFYHAEGRERSTGAGMTTSEVAVPEDAVATVTAAAADAAEGRFGSRTGGQVAIAVNDGLRKHHAAVSSPHAGSPKGSGARYGASAPGRRRVSVSAEGARRLMDTVTAGDKMRSRLRPGTTAGTIKSTSKFGGGLSVVIAAGGSESDDSAGSELASSSAGSGDQADWADEIGAAVDGPQGIDPSLDPSKLADLSSLDSPRGTGKPPRTPHIRNTEGQVQTPQRLSP